MLLQKLFFSAKIVSQGASLVVQVDFISIIKFQVLEREQNFIIFTKVVAFLVYLTRFKSLISSERMVFECKCCFRSYFLVQK
jgi:hypothetical protein